MLGRSPSSHLLCATLWLGRDESFQLSAVSLQFETLTWPLEADCQAEEMVYERGDVVRKAGGRPCPL